MIRAVAADDDDALNAHFTDIIGGMHTHFRTKEVQAACRAQISARLVGDVQDGIQIQLDHVVLDMVALAECAVIAALDTNQGHAIVTGRLCNRHDGGIHSRGVSAGSQNTNTTHNQIRLLYKMENARMRGTSSGIISEEIKPQFAFIIR
ncbi:MAG: hypothetical protein BHW25_08220 [Faecalibacterium sp. CAG:82-related_59_9]|nr:MAG: hypothetical protein BHW25_08220 [Faecalibacterium sp. CAG:82-related_59_9]